MLVDDLAALEKKDGWDAHYTVFGSQVRIGIYVNLDDLGASFIFTCKLLDGRANRLAGPAPFGPEINKYRNVRFQNRLFEFGAGNP